MKPTGLSKAAAPLLDSTPSAVSLKQRQEAKGKTGVGAVKTQDHSGRRPLPPAPQER